MLSWNAFPAFVVVNLLGLPTGILAAALSSSLEARADAPPPLTVLPSRKWEGIDGPWSTFTLNVGTPAQNASILISTASNQPWVVLPDGCPSGSPSTCPNSRGGLFTPTGSWYVPSWVVNQPSGIFASDIGSNYGLNANVTYGYDNVSLGAVGGATPSLGDQVVGGITSKNFYMGMFGLNSASTSFAGTTPVESYMSHLKNKNQIPSLSYGYTAGNQYRFPDAFGSLTLGGYDSSLYVPNDLTVSFTNLTKSDLMINVNQITMSSGGAKKTLSPATLIAFIDSTVPYMYLPVDVCKQFEDAFGITYDPKSELYLVTDEKRKQLLAENANITFTMTSMASKVFVDIVLPYKAFDLKVQAPLVDEEKFYFPLKRSVNAAQITLGRVFLQEAYLIADYERQVFSIHQRDWTAGATPKANVVSIPAINATPEPKPTKSVNVVAITCGAVGGAVLIAVIVGFAIMACRRQKRVKTERAASGSSERGFAKSHHSYQSQSTNPQSTFLHSPNPIHSPFVQSPYPKSLNSENAKSNYTKSIAPSSWERDPPARPDSPTSFYQSEYDPCETQTISGLGAPLKYGTKSMAFSAIDFPADYEPTIADRSPPVSPMPLFEATAMPKPISVIKTKDTKAADGAICELPAREQVGRDLLNYSKKPVWI
ncbi:aspartic peptidase domain-containing protein [Amylocarpus encephaloides]|uniref:Aspartic peptidase domain-containing protein n=1 Tax=Amylocarpus encephaloides TaxID=45428 RepID=A0A9P7YNA0_9HELO|nr:aspartic peptidase domain-containing protein [Amylocarpus encephaloides]